jgi:hypothetical protein
MTDITTVIDRSISLWTEPDVARRQELIAQTFTEDVSYLTPQFAAHGHDGIANMAAELAEHLPGSRYLRASAIDAHNDRVRVGWEVIPPQGAVRFAAGVNFCELAPDGRISAITGFTDFLPHAEGAHTGE